eukprot:TRINITY_DN17104_c0_g1_i2.p1 TRINITY_DN17104_c0_g1~~TRINITY_DN17104_c0_g1_i2.p1  ORF type:complete len:439 (+),score=60.19 TRINITY_DN17104_c0_g1_i2:169-1485(+)
MTSEAIEAFEDDGKSCSRKGDLAHSVQIIRDGPLLPVFIVLSLEIFGSALTLPIVAFFCINELGLSATYLGLIASCYHGAQAIGSPISGRLSDALGRKAVLLGCLAWSGIFFAATYWVRNFYDLLVFRVMAGLSGGSFSVTAAMIMDTATTAERPQVLGIQTACVGFCLILGPVIVVFLLMSGLLVERRHIFIVTALFCFAAFFAGSLILKETLPIERRRNICGAKSGCESETGGHLKEWACVSREMICVWIARFFLAFGTYSMYTTYSFVIHDNFGWTDEQLGMMLGFAGVCSGAFGVFLYPQIDKRLGEQMVCLFGFIIMGPGFLMIPSKTVSWHLVGFFVVVLGQSFSEPGIVNLVGFLCPSERHMGFAQGAGNGFRACASVLAPSISGMLYEIRPFLAYACAAASVFVASIFVLAAYALATPNNGENVALLKNH